MRKFLAPFLLTSILFLVTLTIIAFGRGYRPDFGKKTISPTGLLVATSNPDGAQIFLEGSLKSATNTTLSLPPGWYTVRIVKEGFHPWEKKMKILGEVVAETKALLFPSTPTLVPLTTSGVVAPTLSPGGTKIVYAVPPPSPRAGLWVLNLTTTPLGLSRDLQLISRATNLDFSAGKFFWSPDSKKILVTIGANHYLVEADKENPPLVLSLEEKDNLTRRWQEEAKEKEMEKLVILPPEFAKIASQSAKILVSSPDETKVLYQATASANLPPILASPPIAANPTPEKRSLTPGAIYVYDLKEDKNYEIPNPQLPITNYQWFPSSRHLVWVESDKISLMECDGTNKTVIYSGPFEKFLASSPSGNRLIILTTYNRPGQANLYSISLR